MDIKDENTQGGITRRMPAIQKRDMEDTISIPIIEPDEKREEEPAEVIEIIEEEKVLTEEVRESGEDKEITHRQPEVHIEPEYEKPQEDGEDDRNARKWLPIFCSSVVAVIMCLTILVSYSVPIIIEWGIGKGLIKLITPIVQVDAPPKDINVLLVGTDRGGYRTDTMMIATYDDENDVINVLQLPRDTYVGGNGRRDKKLNSAYFSGVDRLKHEIELSYGIKIQRYLAVELDSFIEMVDALGGVEVYVPIDMDYDDPTPGQNLHIHLKEGLQVLDGEDAEGFVRFRKNNDGSGYPLGDIDRMAAQKDFIMAVVKKVISMDGISKIPELLDIAKNNITTDITNSEAYSYIYKILSMESENIRFYDAPGEMAYYSGWYFFVDEDENDIMVKELFNGDKYKSSVYVSRPASAKRPTNISPSDDEEDIDDSERYTYYTNPEPGESPDASASPKSSATVSPSATPKGTPSITPKATATPKSTPKATATPGVDDEAGEPVATPKPTPKPAPETDASVEDEEKTEEN